MDSEKPAQIEICGKNFDRDIDHFSSYSFRDEIEDMEELRKLSGLPNLGSASFISSNLNDRGLDFVCNARGIDNLCLQATNVTTTGLWRLAGMNQLKGLLVSAEYDDPSREALKFLSRKLPNCTILVKGWGTFLGGFFTKFLR